MIKTFTSNIILSTVLILFCCIFFAPYASASSHLVTPLVYNFDLEKRDIVTENIILTNTSQRVVRVYASVNNVDMDGNGVVENFVSKSIADRSNTATTWIEISRKRIELKPGEVMEVPFTVRMNPLAEPGDYSVFIGFAEGSNRPSAEAKVSQGVAPGTIVHISVDQKQNQFLRLEKFIVDKFVTKPGGEMLTFILSNPGASGVVPAGEVIFYNNSGVEVDAIPVNAQRDTVSSDGELTFEMEIPKDLGMGKYKAFLSVEYGEYLTASVHDTAFFYIVPIKQLIVIFLVVLFAAILIALYLHRRYDVGLDDDGSETVAMYIRDGKSDEVHHDIDLSKKNED